MKKRKNVPLFRRSKGEYQRRALFLMEQRRSGVILNLKESLLVDIMQEMLTPKEKEYLSLYYLTGLTHKQIATYLHCVPSTVSKGVVRGESKLQRIYTLIFRQS